MKKKMKPATRRLVATLAVLVVLAVAAAALLLPGTGTQGTSEDSPSSVSSSSTEKLEIINKEKNTLKSITVENSTGTFTILATINQGATAPVFSVEELADVPTSSESLMSAARYGYNLTATVDVGATSEVLALSEYGLDNPAATLTTRFNDGTADFVLKIGDKNASVGGYYVLANDHVYIAEIGDAVFADKYAFLEGSLFTISVKGNGSDIIEYMDVSGTNFEQPVHVEYTGRDANGPYNALFMPYIVSEPYYSGINTSRIDEFVTGLSALTATGTAGYDPDAAMLAETGLDEPAVVCAFSMNGEEHTIRIGDKCQGTSRYVMVDDNPVVFVVSEDSLSCLTNLTMLTIRDGFVWCPMLKKTSSLTVTCEGKTDEYRIARKEEAASSSSTSSSSEVTYSYSVTKNGQEMAYDDFRPLFSTAITPTILNTEQKELEAEPALTLTFTYYAGGTNTVEYYAVVGGERRYAAYLDGAFVGVVKGSHVADIIEAFTK